MKLVQLLAKELKEWPVKEGECNKESDYCVQSDTTSQVFFCGSHGEIFLSERADETSGVRVTRSEWQAEREKMNKPKWIRHRGGNSTLHPGTMVEARLRSGEIQRAIAGAFLWDNSLSDHAVNIMAYRIIEETKDQEIKEVKDTNLGTLTYKLEIDATEATQQIDSLVAKCGQIESPLKWRDEIIELEAYEEEFRREREKLIRKLESEGFKLIDHMTPVYGEQIIDMSDWRNWQVGDVFVTDGRSEYYTKGKEYVVKSLVDDEAPIKAIDDYGDVFCLCMNEVKFICRP